MRSERPREALDLFRLACYLECVSLQECLLAREIFPHINAYSAVLFLKELFSKELSPCKREPSQRVQDFLADYCMFYLSRNLPVILRQDKKSLVDLPKEVVYELIKNSMYYIVDARADLETTL